jgi:hypothetical protein
MSFSAAMPASLHQQLAGHLLRADGQEDLCLATYAPSTGATRTSAVLGRAILPEPGERAVHGNASFTGSYFVRAAREAASAGRGSQRCTLTRAAPAGRTCPVRITTRNARTPCWSARSPGCRWSG